MSSTKYLTQFICSCVRCGHKTMALGVDGVVTVECNMCDNRRTFSRPKTRLGASIMTGSLEGHFDVEDRYVG